ncbi:hypothetical protein [Pseudomonas zhanjiangensis]|uniref:Methyl-accepting chemotaxis protein n=1 Tax=Pseudomonas zhanjiangensis TaxID=3239015 RepID=A0ABV3YVH2_9PSED
MAKPQSATTEEIDRNTSNVRDISLEVRQCALMVDQVGQQDRLPARFKV